MKIVGGFITHNSMKDIRVAASSLRAVSDVVLAFDDASTDGSVEELRKRCDLVLKAHSPSPRSVSLRRSILFNEAEKLGADWFVYHDADEALSPTIQNALKDILIELGDPSRGYMSVSAEVVHFYGDLRHSHHGGFREVIAWRCGQGLTYYESIKNTIENSSDPMASWHAPRAPGGAFTPTNSFGIAFPYGALLHYANSSPERIAARKAWYQSAGLFNNVNSEPKEGELVTIKSNPEWDDTKYFFELVRGAP